MKTNFTRRLISAAFFSLFAVTESSAQAILPPRKSENIAPGDVLRLKIWREPDMSGEFPVAPNGTVVLPRLGELDATSFPADSLRTILTDRYKVYLNNPSIEVTLLRRVTITGAVKTPGVYPLEPTMTITDALALAGGPSPDGKRDKVEIRRGGKRVDANLRDDTTIADSPVQSGDQLYVPTKPWIARNTWLISAGVSFTAIVLTQLLR